MLIAHHCHGKQSIIYINLYQQIGLRQCSFHPTLWMDTWSTHFCTALFCPLSLFNWDYFLFDFMLNCFHLFVATFIYVRQFWFLRFVLKIMENLTTIFYIYKNDEQTSLSLSLSLSLFLSPFSVYLRLSLSLCLSLSLSLKKYTTRF